MHGETNIKIIITFNFIFTILNNSLWNNVFTYVTLWETEDDLV
jgi:hypothetical protein